MPSKKIRKLRPKLPWTTEKEEQEIKLKHSLFRNFKKSRLQEDRVAFQRQRNKVTQLLRRAERRFMTTLLRSSRSSTSDTRFWSCVKSMTGKQLTNQFLILSQTLAQHCKMMWEKQMLSMSSSRSRLSFKETIVTRIPQACQRIHITSPPFKHHHQKSVTYYCLCQRRKHLDGMTSQLTCYVCEPLVLQRVKPPFLTGHSQMVFFLLHGNWLLSLRFLKKDVWLDRTTTEQLLCFRLLAKSVKKLSTKSFITL